MEPAISGSPLFGGGSGTVHHGLKDFQRFVSSPFAGRLLQGQKRSFALFIVGSGRLALRGRRIFAASVGFGRITRGIGGTEKHPVDADSGTDDQYRSRDDERAFFGGAEKPAHFFRKLFDLLLEGNDRALGFLFGRFHNLDLSSSHCGFVCYTIFGCSGK